MAEIREFIYPGDESPRLDKFLADSLVDFSRVQTKGFIDEGKVTVNGRVRTKAALRIKSGDILQVEVPEVVVCAVAHPVNQGVRARDRPPHHHVDVRSERRRCGRECEQGSSSTQDTTKNLHCSVHFPLLVGFSEGLWGPSFIGL